jgi:hypothetical protein
MSGEDRADRLRRRRQRARDKVNPDETGESGAAGESDETAKSDKAAKTGETAKPDKRGETDESNATGENDEADGADESDEPTLSVKDEQKPTYMYLPHSIRRDLDRSYSMLKAEYEYEYQEGFEKNRHFYPLVVSLGLEAIAELEPEDVRTRLNDE